jgi:hypothetical protein
MKYSTDKDLPSNNFDDFSLYSEIDDEKQKEANIALYEAILNLWSVAEKYRELGAYDTGSRDSIMARVYDLQWPSNANKVKAALEAEKKTLDK